MDNMEDPEWVEEALHGNNNTRMGIFYNSTSSFLGVLVPCDRVSAPQHPFYHVANACFLLSYIPPSRPRGLLFMHSLLILGFLFYSTWAWNVICAPDVFSWNFTCVLLNMGQTLYIAYQMRPVKIRQDLQPLYQTLFEPLHVPRLLFKRLVSVEYAQIMSLHEGEAYAMCNLTKTDRLGLLIEGKADVLSSNHFLHSISPMEFLDSPEFESSRTSVEAKFKVTVVAATSCRYIFWQRSSLEFFFVKEPYMATVMSTLIARDITTKLYSMNHKIVTEKGSQLDIRLPSLTSSLSSSICDSLSYKSPCTNRSFGSHVKSSDLSLASSIPVFENNSLNSFKGSPEISKSPRIQNYNRKLQYSGRHPCSPRQLRHMEGIRRLQNGCSTRGLRPFGSPPQNYSPRNLGSQPLPRAYKSADELLEEDEKTEDEFLLNEKGVAK